MNKKRVGILLFVLFVLFILGYAMYTARAVVAGPQLVLEIPEGIMEVNSQVIEISGTATNAKELRINNAKILMDQDGNFKKRMLLNVGINKFNFVAIDKFGNTRSKTLQVVYSPSKEVDTLKLKNPDL